MSRAIDLLVVGAGPSGLALALQAQAHGAHVRIVDRRTMVTRPSRALIVHPRTLEGLRPLGVTESLLAVSDTAPQADLHLGGQVVQVRLADLALTETAFPHLTLVRQQQVETVLIQALADRGRRRSGTPSVAIGWTWFRARPQWRSPIRRCPYIRKHSASGMDDPDRCREVRDALNVRAGEINHSGAIALIGRQGDVIAQASPLGWGEL